MVAESKRGYLERLLAVEPGGARAPASLCAVPQSRAEAEEAAQLRALNAAAAGRVLKHMPRLPPRQARKLTVAHTPALRTAKRPRIHDASAEVRCQHVAWRGGETGNGFMHSLMICDLLLDFGQERSCAAAHAPSRIVKDMLVQ